MAPLLPAHDGLAAVTPQNLCRTGTSHRTSTRRRRAFCDDNSGSLVVHVPESTVPGLGRGSDGATAARPYWAGSSDATEPLPDGNLQAKTKLLPAVTPQNLCRTGTSKRRQNLRYPSVTKSPGTRNQRPPSDLAWFGVVPTLEHDEMKKGRIQEFV